MDTQQALAELGVRDGSITNEQKMSLDRDGYAVLPDILSLDEVEYMCDELARILVDPDATIHLGGEVIGDLVNESSAFDIAFTHPRVLACVDHVLHHDFKLSSLNMRSALPGKGAQGLHSDTLGVMKTPGKHEICNAVWALDAFTEDNGSTRVIPGSHRWETWPDSVMSDPNAPYPGEIIVTVPLGGVIVFNGHTLHSGTLNSTESPRRALTSPFTRRDLPQQHDQKKSVRPETLARLNEAAWFILDV